MKKTIITSILIIASLFGFIYFQNLNQEGSEGVLSDLTSSLTKPLTGLSEKSEERNINSSLNEENKDKSTTSSKDEKGGGGEESKNSNTTRENIKFIDDYSTFTSAQKIKDILNQNLATLSEKAEHSYNQTKEKTTEKISQQEEIIRNYIVNNSKNLSENVKKEICKQLCETCN
jgi:hypothetical protein